MSKLLQKIIATFILMIAIIPSSFSTNHLIEVEDDEFSPTIFTVNVGDTITWMWDEGIHTTTSTIVPSGAATWDRSIDQTNFLFMYIVTVPGSYDYECSYHASMGMLGHFTATGTTGISHLTTPVPFINSTMISDALKITFNTNPADYSVDIMSLTGDIVKTVKPGTQTAPFTEAIPVEDLVSGIYIVNITGKNNVNSTRIIKM